MIDYKKIIFLMLIGTSCTNKSTNFDSQNTKIYELNFPKTSEKIFIYFYTWGVSGNHNDIVISNRIIRSKKIDIDKDFYFKGAEVMFYKITNDTLHLDVTKKTFIPKMFNSKIKIIQIEKTNSEIQNLYDEYKSQGKNMIGG